MKIMKKYKIAVIVGSLRKESFNLKTAKALIALAPESLSLEVLNIANLPMFNEDLEATPPQEWVTFREKIRSEEHTPELQSRPHLVCRLLLEKKKKKKKKTTNKQKNKKKKRKEECNHSKHKTTR